MLAVLMTAGLAAAQTIDDIQYYNPVTGAPESPYAGQVVTVSGTVYVVAGTYNTGTQYIQNETGGIAFFLASTGLEIGDVVEVTGTVGLFQGEIQISSPSFSLTGSAPEPTPIPLTPAALLADYEYVGSFVAVTGVVASKTTGQFTLEAGTDDLVVYIDADTGIDIGAVAVGDEYLVKSPAVVFNGLIELKPRMQSDLVEDPSGDTVPVISGIRAENYVPMANEPIVIRATIEDNSAVASAILRYRNSDGTTPGAWNSVAMVAQGGDLYQGTIPANHPQSQVDYYIEATDDGAQTVTNPGDAPDGFYSIAVGLTSIYAMQYAHPDSTSQNTPYLGKVLNIAGVVTAGTGEAGAPSKFVVQAQNTGPYGGYAFGGVLVYEGTAANEFYRGDVVEVGGYGNEYFGLTEMEPHNGDAINLLAFGADLPVPARVKTRVIADDVLTDGTGKLGEAWESVWVKTWASQVLGVSAFDEYYISDTAAWSDSCEVEPALELTYVPTVGDVILVEGYVDYAFGAFQVTPLADEYVILTDMVGVDDTPTIEAAGGFKGIYPNPFNPATKISFVLNRDELAQLNVYNLRGELVRTLVNERLPMGDYELAFDGRDQSGQSLASGEYFARLRIGKTVMQVRKLSLVK